MPLYCVYFTKASAAPAPERHAPAQTPGIRVLRTERVAPLAAKKRQAMHIVITYGTYDLLHIGHIMMLKRCKSLGDRLIVGLSTDEFNLKMKNKICVQTYQERKEILEALRYVDQVIPEENWEQKVQDVQNYAVDVFAIGDDWAAKFDFLKPYCKVIYLPRTEGISTTMRKTQIVQTFTLDKLDPEAK